MTSALLATAFVLGLRHGVDWDHIAAIGDLSGSTHERRRGFYLSFLYAIGHAAVVFVLGAGAVVAGAAIPDSFDRAMSYLVGVSLVVLGVWVVVSLLRQGRDFRLRSRWMLMLSGSFAGLRRVRNRSGRREIRVEHEHEHEHEQVVPEAHVERAAHDHAHIVLESDDELMIDAADLAMLAAAGSGAARPTVDDRSSGRWFERRFHSHVHRHELALPDTAAAGYGPGSAAGVGMLHGVGVESPTQMAVFVASTSVSSRSAGLVLLAVWVAGLVVANSVLAAVMGAGLLSAERHFRVYATIAVVVALMSVALGLSYLGIGPSLPSIEI